MITYFYVGTIHCSVLLKLYAKVGGRDFEYMLLLLFLCRHTIKLIIVNLIVHLTSLKTFVHNAINLLNKKKV